MPLTPVKISSADYPVTVAGTEQVVVFDRYDDLSAKCDDLNAMRW